MKTQMIYFLLSRGVKKITNDSNMDLIFIKPENDHRGNANRVSVQCWRTLSLSHLSFSLCVSHIDTQTCTFSLPLS